MFISFARKPYRYFHSFMMNFMHASACPLLGCLCYDEDDDDDA